MLLMIVYADAADDDDAGAFLASAKELKPEARGDILLHNTDVLLAHNKVARWEDDNKMIR